MPPITDTVTTGVNCSLTDWATVVTAFFAGLAVLATALGVKDYLTLRLDRSRRALVNETLTGQGRVDAGPKASPPGE